MMTKKARALRKNLTETENYLWQFLRNRLLKTYKFRRQHVIGPYIVDFVCEKKKLNQLFSLTQPSPARKSKFLFRLLAGEDLKAFVSL